jgi:hypothetical protein
LVIRGNFIVVAVLDSGSVFPNNKETPGISLFLAAANNDLLEKNQTAPFRPRIKGQLLSEKQMMVARKPGIFL